MINGAFLFCYFFTHILGCKEFIIFGSRMTKDVKMDLISNEEALNALLAIENETVPIEDHPDPKAISDCFHIIRDYISQNSATNHVAEGVRRKNET